MALERRGERRGEKGIWKEREKRDHTSNFTIPLTKQIAYISLEINTESTDCFQNTSYTCTLSTCIPGRHDPHKELGK